MNKITIFGVIGSWSVSAEHIVYQLSEMSGDVLVLIDSRGGSVLEGIAIYNAFRAYDKGKITFRIVGVAASIASYIVFSGDTVEAYDNATFMIHNAWLPVTGDHRALRKGALIAEGFTTVIAAAYISKTGRKDIPELMDEESFYFGDEILDAGFVDTVLTTETEASKAEAIATALTDIRACEKEVIDHADGFDFESAAALLDECKRCNQIPPEVVDLSAQQHRERQLSILEKGMSLCQH